MGIRAAQMRESMSLGWLLRQLAKRFSVVFPLPFDLEPTTREAENDAVTLALVWCTGVFLARPLDLADLVIATHEGVTESANPINSVLLTRFSPK